MKKILSIVLLGVVFISCNETEKEEVKLNFEDESTKLTYSLAIMTANDLNSFKEQFDFFDDTVFQQGLTDAFNEKSQMDLMAAQQTLNEYSSKQRDSQINKNIAEGDTYLKENGAKEGVVVLESGMQYEILQEGSGEKPNASSDVKVHYHGSLINGTVFDSSVDRGEPIVFNASGVIQGWTQILQLMPVGSKWKVSIPYNLAYGAQGGGGVIPPYATLIFEMELLEIVK